jgi:hypothetical protein
MRKWGEKFSAPGKKIAIIRWLRFNNIELPVPGKIVDVRQVGGFLMQCRMEYQTEG